MVSHLQRGPHPERPGGCAHGVRILQALVMDGVFLWRDLCIGPLYHHVDRRHHHLGVDVPPKGRRREVIYRDGILGGDERGSGIP